MSYFIDKAIKLIYFPVLSTAAQDYAINIQGQPNHPGIAVSSHTSTEGTVMNNDRLPSEQYTLKNSIPKLFRGTVELTLHHQKH